MNFLPTAAGLTEKLPRVLRRHKLMKAWMWLTGESPIQLVRIRGDYFAYADMSDGFLRLVPIEGGYDEEFFRIADPLLSQGGTFLDVGANFGLLSFGLAGRYDGSIEFHLFEPNGKLVEIIARSRSRYPDMRCEVNPVAVSDRAGAVTFCIDDGQTGASHIAGPGEAGNVEVSAITLDAYLTEHRILRVELLKLDVEGFELSACRGAEASLKGRTILAVFFEYFEKFLIRNGEPNELIAYLDSLGFVTCFCRRHDLENFHGATHTITAGLPGHGLELRPVKGNKLPAMTDLLAIPEERLVALESYQ